MHHEPKIILLFGKTCDSQSSFYMSVLFVPIPPFMPGHCVLVLAFISERNYGTVVLTSFAFQNLPLLTGKWLFKTYFFKIGPLKTGFGIIRYNQNIQSFFKISTVCKIIKELKIWLDIILASQWLFIVS